jgi:hypothetical protein
VRAKQPDRLGLHYAHPEARGLRLARSTVALGVAMPDQLKRPKNRAIRSRFTTIDSSQVPWKIKARVKIQLHVKTRTRVAAEFESSELNREKVVPVGQSAVIYIGPLSPGSQPTP